MENRLKSVDGKTVAWSSKGIVMLYRNDELIARFNEVSGRFEILNEIQDFDQLVLREPDSKHIEALRILLKEEKFAYTSLCYKGFNLCIEVIDVKNVSIPIVFDDNQEKLIVYCRYRKKLFFFSEFYSRAVDWYYLALDIPVHVFELFLEELEKKGMSLFLFDSYMKTEKSIEENGATVLFESRKMQACIF